MGVGGGVVKLGVEAGGEVGRGVGCESGEVAVELCLDGGIGGGNRSVCAVKGGDICG